MCVSFDDAGAQRAACHFPALVEGGLTLVLEGRFWARAESGEFVALPQGFVSGARPHPVTLYRTAGLRCIGLRLRPAGTIGLLRSSPASLPGGVVDAADVFGPAWNAAVARMREASSPSDSLRLLFAFAAERLRDEAHGERLRRATSLLQTALGSSASSADPEVGARQFQRRFHANFGVTPKLFQRVARVEALLRDALGTGAAGVQLALRHGYFDQSHMARDLRLLAGAPLSELVEAARRPDSGHWALAAGTARVPR
jgi:AraC-like DNA-binding protein